ncbi:MAG: peptide chain release factor N(5)-glutamine methyltransferase [Anaeroplasmataceae bacterium]
MTYNEALNQAKEKLLINQKEESVAYIALMHVSALTSPQLFQEINSEIKDDVLFQFNNLISQHINENIPIQYLVGKSDFYGYEFNVSSDVLIPRYETEELVENILSLYDEYFLNKKIELCDIGTGSGCIAITLALEEKNINVTATDISFDALKVAKSNNDKLKANVKFIQGDMLEPLRKSKFDILVSNPPYIPNEENVMSLVKDNEPNLALFGGEDGLKFYRIILKEANLILNDKSIICFEHAFDKAIEIKNLALRYFPNATIISKKDLQNKDRMTFIINGF